ncbi:MAG: type II toxin-antitoxin system Phd/YefM family antitoxin [Rubrivivax sp.]
MPVSVRELKTSLSQVLSRARSGEIIEVTSRNKSPSRGSSASPSRPRPGCAS